MFFLFLPALALFVALNGVAAGAFVLGFIILVTLWLRRKAEFWSLLLALTSLLGGAGALVGSWGAFYGASALWPDSVWPFWGWMGGYILGGVGGVFGGAFGVALLRRRELPDIEAELKARFRALKTQFSTLGFRQSLRVGAYSLRVAFFRRKANSGEPRA